MAASLAPSFASAETAPQAPEPAAVSTHAPDFGRTAVCTELRELRTLLGQGDAEPLFIFADEKGVYGSVEPMPDKVREQTDDLEDALTIAPNTVRGDRLGTDSLGAIATSELAADATDDVLDEFAEYADPLEGAVQVDQSGAAAMIIQAREATDTALLNCEPAPSTFLG